MISFFPAPYPDELLYSVIARYHVRSGNTSPKATVEELFDSRMAAAVVDMPCYIGALVNKIHLHMNLTAEDLIIRHTLFPYYAVFLSYKRANGVLKSMKSSYGGDVHTSTGIMASSVRTPEYLRFCPECNARDYLNYGEYYWHRLHQIPGILICPIHNVILQDSTVSAHGLNKHEFISAGEDNCRNTPTLVSYTGTDLDRLTNLAKDIAWLVEHYADIKSTKGLDGGLRERYLSILKDRGLATSKSRVYQEQLVNDFKNFYGDDFLDIVQSNVEYESQNNWLASIVRKHRKSFHPLRHLLLIRFLTGSVEDFFKDRHTVCLPFGKGPWPCLNAAAEHYKKPVIKDLTVTHCSDTKLPVGTFKCSCGFTYSRRGPDKAKEDMYKIGRIKQFGSVWENKLRGLVEAEKLSLRETARRLNVDANTVKKYTRFLNLNAARQNEKQAIGGFVDCDEIVLRQYHRIHWQKLVRDNPENYKTELRRLAKATFAWLYRHDRKWLDSNSPSKERCNLQQKRVDWNKRDKSALKQVKQAVKGMLNSGSEMKRITKSRVGKKTGLLALLEKHLDKLPGTMAYLDSAIETVEEYQIRRVKWAAKQLDVEGEELRVWKIRRKAGLKAGCTACVEKAVTEEIEKYSKHYSVGKF